MKNVISIVSVCLAGSTFNLLPAQTATPAGVRASVTQSVDVVTTVEPLPLSANDRFVEILDTREPLLLLNSLPEYLRLDPSVNVQARGGNGVQSDISMRGTTFEQTLVLVNGLRINDPETGHLNFDLPVPLEAVARMDVLHGAGSTFYGSDAIGGAVNLVTDQPASASLLVKAGFGSYGGEEQHLRADYVKGRLAEELSGSRDVSDGFIADRGYHENLLASETWLNSHLGTTDVLLSGSDRPYGANKFYGVKYDSWERTKSWFAAIEQQIGPKTAVSLGYLRHTDLFVLFNKRPMVYENNHVATVWEGALRRVDRIGSNGSFSYGLEADLDSIESTNLGRHGRNNGAGYANLSLRALGRFSLTAGAREEIYGGGSMFSPNAAVAFTAAKSVRLRASVGHGFRLPTYTDLYYSDPASIGNPNLKPESAWSYDGGLDWTPGGRISGSAGGFRLQQKDSIDYSKYSLAAKWQASNVSDLNLTGAEGSLKLRVSRSQEIRLGYTAVRAAAAPAGLISEYAYNYAAQNAVLSWTGDLRGQVVASTQVGVVQRTGKTAYPLWDISLARSAGRVRPYLRVTNLANTAYQEIPGVVMQGRALMGGVAYYLRARK
jgi:outer membrane cobalamin receptor